MAIHVSAYNNDTHREQVIALWNAVFGYETSHNVPSLVIDKKLDINDGLFFIARDGHTVIGTVMAGYDGHRGWIYSMCVSPDYQGQGIGSALLQRAERALSEKGCMKVNLQIMEGNEAVVEFYKANGYRTEKRISMGKRLEENIPKP